MLTLHDNGILSFSASTAFHLGVIEPGRPNIVASELQPGGLFRLEALGVPSSNYVVQATDTLPATVWDSVTNVIAGLDGSFFVSDGMAGRTQQFYRVAVPGPQIKVNKRLCKHILHSRPCAWPVCNARKPKGNS